MSGFRWTCEWARSSRVSTIAELETTSTNLRAKEDLSTSSAGTMLYITDHQTMGRGRGAHEWSDLPGQALLSSWVYESVHSPQPVFSIRVGLALFDAAKSTWPNVAFSLKAPNDLHILDQQGTPAKVGGLLIEVVSLSSGKLAVIIGLGLNTHGAPQGTLPYPATCLGKECAKSEQPLTESDFRKFLTSWHSGCVKLIADASEPKLSSHETHALKLAMIHHPEAKGLANIAADGSLHFEDGRNAHWSNL